MAAEIIGEAALDRPLTKKERAVGATATHYAFGACMGALYGCFVETGRRGTWMNGAAFGTSVWAGADEAAMPALGLSGPTTERPTELHLQSLASHLVYGVAAEAVRRGVRAALR
jgi:putative membrane protein